MKRALFRKQLMEVFSFLYQDKKSGKARSTGALVGYIALYTILFGFLAVLFFMMGLGMIVPLVEAGMGWLYWCIMGLVAIFFGVFGSVFNTYASLYLAKDNDLLLALPLPPVQILLARLSGVYALGTLYELLVMIPAVLVWLIFAPAYVTLHISGVVCTLLSPVVLSVIVLVLSAVLGWVVSLIASRLRHKNLITVVVSLAFIAAYYYFYAKSFSLLESLLANLGEIGGAFKTAALPLYLMGRAAEGSLPAMLGFMLIAAALFGVTLWVLSRSFIRLATANRGAAKTRYREKAARPRSASRALLGKELRRFTGSANYMLNCGLSMLLMPLSAVVLLWKNADMRPILSMIPHDAMVVLAVAAVCMMSSMNDMTAPSVSLEGKNLWIAQSLPISPWQILLAKVRLQVLLTLIPALPLMAASCYIAETQLGEAILICVTSALYMLFAALSGVALNLKMPNLTWKNETIPIKQSTPVVIALLGGWGLIGILALLYVVCSEIFGAVGYLAALCVLFCAAIALLARWLRVRGTKIFAAL